MSGCLVRLGLLILAVFYIDDPWFGGVLLTCLIFEGVTSFVMRIVTRLDSGERPTDLHDALGFKVRRVD